MDEMFIDALEEVEEMEDREQTGGLSCADPVGDS